jgi:hypothetical protein
MVLRSACLAIGRTVLLFLAKVMRGDAERFLRPAEIARGREAGLRPDERIRTAGEGEIGEEILIAPMSGLACLFFEIEVSRRFARTVRTSRGLQRRTGAELVERVRRGCRFHLRDAEGAIEVDARERCDVELEPSHKSTIRLGLEIPRRLEFGELEIDTPELPGDSHSTAFVGTERILRPGPLVASGVLREGVLASGRSNASLILAPRPSGQARERLRSGPALCILFGGALALALGGVPAGLGGAVCLAAAACARAVQAEVALLPAGLRATWTVTAPSPEAAAIAASQSPAICLEVALVSAGARRDLQLCITPLQRIGPTQEARSGSG